jgi:hypothetical protein
VRVALATCAALLAVAAPATAAHDFVRYNLLYGGDLAAAEGPFFLAAESERDFTERSFRINLRTGAGRRIHLPGLGLRAGGDRLAVQQAVQAPSSPEFNDTAVISMPAKGGPPTTLASAHAVSSSRPRGFCGRYVELVDVTTDGRVITNESRKPCDIERRGHGALYAYSPAGRRLLTRRRVLTAFLGGQVRVAGDWVLVTGNYRSHETQSTYLVNPRTGTVRRLLRDVGVYTQDVDRHGNAVVSYLRHDGDRRVRLFLADGTSRVIARPSGSAHARFCGDGLAVFQFFGERLLSLTFRDHPTARPRTLLFSEPGYAIPQSACNSSTFAFVEDRLSDDGYTSQTTVRAYSLRPRQSGEPRSAAP